MPREHLEQRRRGDSEAVIVARAAFLLGVPDRASGRDVGALIDGLHRARIDLREQAARGDADITQHRNGDGVEATDRVRVGVDLNDRLVRGDTGVIRERRAEDDQQI